MGSRFDANRTVFTDEDSRREPGAPFSGLLPLADQLSREAEFLTNKLKSDLLLRKQKLAKREEVVLHEVSKIAPLVEAEIGTDVQASKLFFALSELKVIRLDMVDTQIAFDMVALEKAIIPPLKFDGDGVSFTVDNLEAFDKPPKTK
jgi:hypothetical protein